MRTLIISLLLLSFSAVSSQEENYTKTYKNNFTIKPFNANVIGLGVGFQYERYLDSTNNFSVVIPIEYSFDLLRSTYTHYVNEQYGISTNPGVRLYFVNPRSFNWYIGTSIVAGMSESETAGIHGWFITTKKAFLGTMVNVGFKGTIQERVTYNVEIGNGVNFYYNEKHDDVKQNINPTRYIASILVGFGYNF